MHISDPFIERVLSGNGTEEEKRILAEYFKNNPEKMAQYMSEQGWEAFEPDPYWAVPKEKMLSEIAAKVGRAPVRKISYKWMAAASVVLLVCLGTFFYRKSGKADHPENKSIVLEPVARKKDTTSLLSFINESPDIRNYTLPDGSSIKLSGHSSVSFHSPFTDKKRDIFLQGEAVFNVARDQSKPFSVHSSGITTTALGTVFSVNDKGSRNAIVRLFSGRIVVKMDRGAAGGSFRDVYIMPGQELLLNRADLSFQVRAAAGIKGPGAKVITIAGLPDLETFSQRSLPEIFDQLQKDYHVGISYDSASIKSMDFTGEYNHQKESVESFLNTVCELNDLILLKTDSTRFTIRVK